MTTTSRPLRVVVGDDEALLREGLVLMLEHAGFAVLGVAEDAPGLVSQTRSLRPDLVVSDIRMPPPHTDDGLRAALEIRATLPEVAVVLTSPYVQRRYALELVQNNPAGVGYLLKQRVTDVATFCAQLRTVAAGGTVLDPEVVAPMMARARRDDVLSRVTPRQREVLAGMAEGHSNAAIARALSISEKAVVLHASHVYDELDLPVSEDSHRRVLAVLRYLAG